jgi:predicted RNA methylase
MSDGTRVRQQRNNVVERYGPWTAHFVHLGDGVYTSDQAQADTRLRRYLQVAADMVLDPLEKIRVLDLACLEGHFGIEFALHGAKVAGLEGREVNLAKARFAKEALSLDNLKLIHDDVRTLDRDRFGGYDVILVLGILYHLDTPDVMNFVQKVFECCDRVAIIDTQFSLKPKESYTWKGDIYWGEYWEERKPGGNQLWASIGNQRSYNLTRASLCNLLRHVGFTSVYECLNPYEYHNPNWPLPAQDDRHVVHKDRTTFVAIKGRHQPVMSSPITEASPEIDRPEIPEYSTRERLPLPVEWARKLLAPLPEPTKAVLRKMYRFRSGAEARKWR